MMRKAGCASLSRPTVLATPNLLYFRVAHFFSERLS